MAAKKITQLNDLTPDPRNANRGTQRGASLLETSLRKYGAGRSILADRDGVVIAGNKTLEQAAALGLDIQTVHSDGTKLVVVVRDDLTMNDAAAKELGIADNRVSEVSLEWEPAVLEELSGEIDLSAFFFDEELSAVLEKAADDILAEIPDDRYQEQYGVIVICDNAAEQERIYTALNAEGYTCRVVVT